MSPNGSVKSSVTFSEAMGARLTEMADNDNKICAVTAAMCDGTGLCEFRAKHKERFFDVGIAEEHALTFSAGLAANGMRPAAAIYSTFLQRGYDNIIHDVALQKLPVVIFVDRAGLNAADGATHHGIFDVAFLSQIPDMTIYTPITIDSLYACMDEAFKLNAPCAIRYPNGIENEVIKKEFYGDGVAESPSIRTNFNENDSPRTVIITHGRIAAEAVKASELLSIDGIPCGIILLEKLKPYEITADAIMKALPSSVELVAFLEEEILNGGMGMILADKLRAYDAFNSKKHILIGVDDSFVKDRAVGESIYKSAGIDAESIYLKIKGADSFSSEQKHTDK